MTVTAGPAFVDPWRARAPLAASAGTADAAEQLDPLVRRYFTATVAPGRVAPSVARFWMRGVARAGRLRMPFSAVELLAPGQGFARVARVPGGLRISETCLPGEAVRRVEWRRRTLTEDDSTDALHRGTAHLALGAMWVPGAVAPGSRARWRALDAHRVGVSAGEGETPEVVYRLHSHGLPLEVRTLAWGDPYGTGLPDWFPYGGDVLEHRTFEATTLPSTLVLGWFPGTPQYVETLRVQLTACEPIDAEVSSAEWVPAGVRSA